MNNEFNKLKYDIFFLNARKTIELLDEIAKHDEVYQTQLVNDLGWNQGQLSVRLKKLIKLGILNMESKTSINPKTGKGTNKRRYYSINEDKVDLIQDRVEDLNYLLNK